MGDGWRTSRTRPARTRSTWSRFQTRARESGRFRRPEGRSRSGPIAGASCSIATPRATLAVEVNTSPTFSLGRATVLFPAARFTSLRFNPQYAVAPDDQRLLMIRPLQTGTHDT